MPCLSLGHNTDKQTIEFVNQIIKDCDASGLVIEWNQGSFTVKLPDPDGSGIKIVVFSVDKKGLVAKGLSGGKFRKLGLPHEIGFRFAVDNTAMLPGVTPNPIKR